MPILLSVIPSATTALLVKTKFACLSYHQLCCLLHAVNWFMSRPALCSCWLGKVAYPLSPTRMPDPLCETLLPSTSSHPALTVCKPWFSRPSHISQTQLPNIYPPPPDHPLPSSAVQDIMQPASHLPPLFVALHVAIRSPDH